jgi:hypothetical protein
MWTQLGPRLPSRSRSCEGHFGQSIALSGDADTALVSDGGFVLPFARSGLSWSRQGPPVSCLEGYCGALYGFSLSLALSGDGNVALVGAAPEDVCGRYMLEPCGPHGLALAFDRFGTTWVQRRPPLEGSLRFGAGVALSSSGESGLIGEYAYAPIGESAGSGAYLIPPPPLNNFSAGEPATRRSGEIDQQIASSTAGTFTASTTVSTKELRLAHGSRQTLISYGRGTAHAVGPGVVTVKIRPTTRARRALSRHRSIEPELHVTIRFKPRTGAAPTPQTFSIYLRRG